MRSRGKAVLFTVILLSAIAARGQAMPEAVRGVIVEEVAKGSPGEKAGVTSGDVILSWSRETAGGDVRSPFDLADVFVEQAPRGTVTLRGRRGSAAIAWTFSRGSWGIRAAPLLGGELATLYREGKERIAAGDLDAGTARWRNAAAAARAGGDRLTAAWFQVRLARAFAAVPRWPEADAAFGEAIDVVRPAAATAAAQIFREWGETFQRRSGWDEAAERYQKALAIDREAAPESLAAAASLTGLGTTAGRRGDLAGSAGWFMQSLALREKLAPGSSETAGSLRNLGVTAGRRGDLATAEDYFRRSAAVEETIDPQSPDLAALFNNLGNVANIRGDLALAEERYRRSLAIYQALSPDGEDVAQGLSNLGIVAMYRSDLATADDLLRRAFAIQEKLQPESLQIAATLNNLGTVAARRGELEAAEAFHHRALTLREKLAPGSPDVAESLGNLGAVAWSRGDLATAAAALQGALAIHGKLSPGSLYMALDLDLIAEVAIDRADWPAAEAALRQAREIADKQAPGGLLASDVAFNFASMAAKRSDFAGAAAEFRRSLGIREKVAPGSIRQASAQHALGEALHRAAHPGEAAEALCAAADTLDRQRTVLGGSDEGKSSFSASFAGFYHDCLAARVELGQPEEAFHVLERGRARSFLALLAERDLHLDADLPAGLAGELKSLEAGYGRAQAALGDPAHPHDEAETGRLTTELHELSGRREALADRIRHESPRFAALKYPEPLTLAAARAALDAGTVLLAYSVGEQETFLFAARAGAGDGGLAVYRLPLGDKALREEIEAFRHLLQREGSDRAALAGRAAHLYDALLRPAEPLVSPAERLLVIADGPLQTLPFAALVRDGRYLVEWKPIHAALSATAYAEGLRQRRATRDPGPPLLAAFGDPSYPALAADRLGSPEVRSSLRRGLELTPLPSTRREIESLAALYPQAQVYLGAAATEENAKAIAPHARLLHFACHGLLDERFPLSSALALSIPEQPKEGQDNGLLQAWEIFESMRLDADLVTLSACDSGLGKEMGGEGLIGLTRAFQYAGARSVLASLWSVSDVSTADLMQRFYSSLRQGKSKDEALRAAQIDLLRGPEATSHPFHWAAFQLSGDWR